ncbi:pirin family protein [Thorsellia anophelis]|uniref:Pirin n=1 Tax=Thorsellia anophelis DSM 18579 TaxID=1123402 RepID=A0A1H9ZRH9_9GAMM|nr:pirin family protein [Thorsellia anophelis]SES84308.1 hypothetical protein SAMN02583745_00664 [Thorsellia anophelis DSM 18579]
MSNKNASGIITINPLGFPWPVSDPFLFCAYHEDDYPKGNTDFAVTESLIGRNIGSDFVKQNGYRMYHGKTVPGFPAHPHCGFETVTIVEKGFVDHSDSLGASARYGLGDVQWLTTGSGIMHAEMFPLLDSENRNQFELFQIWLNLPAKSKQVPANFAMFWANEIANFTIGTASKLKLTTGSIGQYQASIAPPSDSWAADPENDVVIAMITLEEGDTFVLPKANKNDSNRTIYFYEGSQLQVDETLITRHSSIQLDSSYDVTLTAKVGQVKVLLLQGQAIKEPVAQHGPFVMNTQEELVEMVQLYQQTQYGGWSWGRLDPVHGAEKKRFAKSKDGLSIPK